MLYTAPTPAEGGCACGGISAVGKIALLGSGSGQQNAQKEATSNLGDVTSTIVDGDEMHGAQRVKVSRYGSCGDRGRVGLLLFD